MELALWEQLLLGAGAVLLVFLFRPGIKAALEKSRTAESRDWRGALLPIGAVVLFVIVLVLLARG